jgi:hypothetical protein
VDEIIQFKIALKGFLNTHLFYSVEEYLSYKRWILKSYDDGE